MTHHSKMPLLYLVLNLSPGFLLSFLLLLIKEFALRLEHNLNVLLSSSIGWPSILLSYAKLSTALRHGTWGEEAHWQPYESTLLQVPPRFECDGGCGSCCGGRNKSHSLSHHGQADQSHPTNGSCGQAWALLPAMLCTTVQSGLRRTAAGSCRVSSHFSGVSSRECSQCKCR